NLRRKKPIAALATDLDGTICSTGGSVAIELLTQLEGLRRKGLKLILVTGRALLDLRQLIDVSRFDALVVENGAILVINDVKTSLAPEGWRTKRARLLRSLTSFGH